CNEGINDVTRHFSGRDHDDVETDVAIGVLRMAREPQLRRADHAALGSLGHRLYRLVYAATGFDFDECHHATPPGDDVDLAEWCFPPPLQDAISLGDQKQRRAALCRQAALESDNPLRLRRRFRWLDWFSAARHVCHSS